MVAQAAETPDGLAASLRAGVGTARGSVEDRAALDGARPKGPTPGAKTSQGWDWGL